MQLLAMSRRLARRNRWQQLEQGQLVLMVVAVGSAALALAWLANAHTAAIASGIAWTLRFPLALVVIVGWITLILAARERQRSRRDAEHSWLSALPLGKQAFAAVARRRIASVLATVVVMTVLLLFALGWLCALPFQSIATLVLLLAAGMVFGAGIGWVLARKAPRSKRIRLPSIAARVEGQRFPLGRWPLSHSRAHADLALHARAIGALLLALPVGVPPLVVIAIIVFGLMALAILDITRALLTTTRQAGAWLRGLPLHPRKATLALGSRSVLVIVAATIVLVAATWPMGMHASTAIAIGVAIGTTIAAGFVVMAAFQQPFGARR